MARGRSGTGPVNRLALLLVLILAAPLTAQDAFSRADTLRGSNGPARSWYDVTYYDLNVRVSPQDSAISGWNVITYRVEWPSTGLMQIDLQAPLQMDSVVLGDRHLDFHREGDAFFVAVPGQRVGETHSVAAYYHGRPVVAARPPWDGGFIWESDGAGNPWVATANQGLGASVWWPNKDYQAEEPDSQRIAMTVPMGMMNVSNGRLRSTTENGDGTTTWEWFVSAPINNYGVAVNAGTYAHWQELFDGEAGVLTLDFYPLAENEEAARAQWSQTQPMMRCFEHWFGPYPWYEDGFKMVETPHLGMEHQSAIAYGNGYQNGYRGTDLSGTGHGLEWDFIIVHEAAHEWWGNNITTEDVADMWVHEGFANYSESLYHECLSGSKQEAAEYVIGTRARIQNDVPIIGTYGVQSEGSGDMYYKGGNLLHTIRQLVDDDELWRAVLRGLNRDFRRAIVTSAQVERYIARHTGLELGPVFEQYLRTTRIPALEWRSSPDSVQVRWSNTVEGFDMPVRVSFDGGPLQWIQPTSAWQSVPAPGPDAVLTPDDDFYVTARQSNR